MFLTYFVREMEKDWEAVKMLPKVSEKKNQEAEMYILALFKM